MIHMEGARLNQLCKTVAERLALIDGVVAIVLGGSQARGTARPDSDVDLGLYYRPEAPFSVDELNAAARELDDRRADNLMTRFGDWGAGVNGGGWLEILGNKVDLLYRDLGRVSTAIDACRAGRPAALYQLGHPLGFQSQIWMGEIHYCRALFDPAEAIERLKSLTAEYPEVFRRALIEKHLFDAGFELGIARSPAAAGDLMFVSGCVFRAAGFMTLVLFALNRKYYVNEKGAFAESRGFALKPVAFHDEVEQVLSQTGRLPPQLNQSLARLEAVLAELRRLCEAS